MASGTIRSSFTGEYGLEIRWSSVPDVNTNTSQVTMKVYMLYPSIKVTNRSGCYTIIDGKKVEFSASSITNEYKGETLIKTRTETIAHESDGTKKIQLVAYYPVYLKSESLGWIYEKKASGTAVLDDIPRSSSIMSQSTAVTANGTDKWAVMVNRHSDAFWHKATLTIGDKVHVTEPFATSCEYVIPEDWLNAIPDTLRGTVDVSIQTYSDSTCETAVGDAVKSSFEIVVPSTAAPIIEDGWASIAPYNTGAVSAFSSIYVQGYSQAQVTFDGSKVSAQHGATIAGTQISWDGNTTDTEPYRTQVLSRNGSQAIKCIVTDSRGLKSTKELAVNVLPYAKPTLNGISIYRSTVGGTASDTGTYIFFKATGVYSDLDGKNVLIMKAAYRTVGTSVWTESTIISGTGAAVGAVSTTSSYDARITAVDALGNSASFNAVIPTAEAAFNIKPGGRGAAFGKYAELENVLDIDFMTRFGGGILHPVLPVKTDLNDILTPNAYVGTEANTGSYLNCPIASGSFSLDVTGMGEEGNVRQRLQVFSKSAPVTYERFRHYVQPIDVTGKAVEIEVSRSTDLNVVTTIKPVQAGSGDPSPDNIRPIAGYESATLAHNETAYTVDFGQAVYSGTLNWNTGLLTVDRKTITLTGNEVWRASSVANAYYFGSNDNPSIGLNDINYAVAGSTGKIIHICSHYKAANYSSSMTNHASDIFNGAYGISVRFKDDNRTTLDAWKAYIANQYAAGTPVQVCCELTKPITMQLAAHEIYALPGRNTFSCDAGEINVKSVGNGWGRWINTMLYNYPVGSMYMSSDPTSPEEIMGGTWVQIKDRFILAAGDTYAAGSTGGEAEHTLTVDEMPNHSHTANVILKKVSPTGTAQYVVIYQTDEPNDLYVNATGGSQPHNNMPPYMVVYMWQRTA